MILFIYPGLLVSPGTGDTTTADSDNIQPPVNQPESNKDFVLVEGGNFVLGCMGTSGQDCFETEKPAHNVTLNSFWIGKTEVTQKEWMNVMGSNPSEIQGDVNLPVERVSWYDAIEYCNQLSLREGLTPAYSIRKDITDINNKSIYDKLKWVVNFDQTANGYRLPTEAEWEYAAKGGKFKDDFIYSGSNNPDEVAWYDVNSGSTTHPAAQKNPNRLGVYDMSGNVWEWCWDWYGKYNAATEDNPGGAGSGNYKVIRGGNWGRSSSSLRVTNRGYRGPNGHNVNIGFRVVKNL
ncbi:MAG: SUMF1/EgtB/PvdO family nonheme iron enzyme [Ignavibacteriaceae bacterium]|nr:SUMF1/EgtB/PvdO family nonheme iron enzyme [Ignavibacteriaceae bacterium]